MNKNLIEFKKHFENKTTLVFQYKDEKYVINGCQIFLEKEKDDIFEEFEVDLKYQNNVNEALEKLNDNIDKKELLYIIETYPDFIEYVKQEEQDYEMALTAVKNKGYSLQYIREDLQDYEMGLTAVRESSVNIQYVRKDLQDYEMAMIAVGYWGRNIKYVREDLQDYNMALIAVRKRGYVLNYIREDLHTEELCEIVVKEDRNNINFIKCPVMKNKFENKSN